MKSSKQKLSKEEQMQKEEKTLKSFFILCIVMTVLFPPLGLAMFPIHFMNYRKFKKKWAIN